MPAFAEPAAIRALLNTDRSWAVYALGDLAPGFFEHTHWLRAPAGVPALALLYRAFTPPVLFTLGPAAAVQSLLPEIGREAQFHLSVRPDVLTLLKTCYRIRDEKAMGRMILDREQYRPAVSRDVVPLGPADLDAVQRLYADGEPSGEMPDCFHPPMLEHGIFSGVWEGRELVAAAGTHLVVPGEGVAAVGNVYTRRDRRGRGLARRTTSTVVTELLRRGVSTVALNVAQHNQAARRVYEQLGFAPYCDFFEGLATRTPEHAGGGANLLEYEFPRPAE